MRLSYRLAFWLIVWLCVSFLVFNLVVLTIDPYKYSFDDSERKIQRYGAAPYHQVINGVGDESGTGAAMSTSSGERPHLIDTPGCRLPNPDINHPSAKGVVRQLDPFVCACMMNNGLTYVGENRTVVVNKNSLAFINSEFVKNKQSDFYCCLWYIERHVEEDNEKAIRFSKSCIRFRDSIQASNDYVKVECFAKGRSIYEAFHVIPMRHADVEQRCNGILQQEGRQSDSTDSTTGNGTISYCVKGEERLSVLILLLDSMSRFNFHRSLPKSRRYLLDELDAVELDAYSRVGENTFPNLLPLLGGMSESEIRQICWPDSQHQFDNCSFLWSDYAAAGYRTAFVEDQPDIGLFHYEKRGFRRKPTDYYGHSFFAATSKWSHRQNDCLNGKTEAEFIFQWAYDLKRLFARGERFFGLFFESRFTHDDVNRAQIVDSPLRHYLHRFKEDGLLDDTLLIVMGDHGLRFGDFRKTDIGSYEVNLPSSFVVFPPSFRQRHPALMDNLRNNARSRLTTHFDVHRTLKDVLHCSYNAPSYGMDGPADRPKPWSRGISLLRRIPEGRTCADAGVPIEYCPCQLDSQPIEANSTDAQVAASSVVKMVNHLTSKRSEVCARYTLDQVLVAKAIVVSKDQLDAGKLMFEVTVQVQPGGAIFQGTVFKTLSNNVTLAQLGVSRLNLYGNSSACVSGDAVMRKFCFCL